MANSKVTYELRIFTNIRIKEMLSYGELKKGARILFKGQPYEIIESAPLFKARGQSILQAKIKNLITGAVVPETFHPSDSFEEPEVSRIDLKYIYSHRNNYVFSEKDNPSKRFELTEEQIGKAAQFLKQNQQVEGIVFEENIVGISLPIKVELKVTQAPPAIRGQSAQGGTKPAVLETGAKINVPLFINSGDMVEVNTETGEYVKRVN